MLPKMSKQLLLAFTLICATGLVTECAAVTLSSVEPYGLLPRESAPTLLGETVRVALAQGECEPAAIVVDNSAAEAKNIEFQAFFTPGEDSKLTENSIRLERIVHLPARGGGESADQLLPLADVDVVGCPAGERRYLWLTVNSRELAPSTYSGAVDVRVLSPKPERITIPVEITVWPFVIPERAPIAAFTWDCSYATSTDAALANYTEHKVNYFMRSLRSIPGAVPSLKPEGSLQQEPDFTALTPALQRGKSHGSFVFATHWYFGGSYAGDTENGRPWRGSNTPYMSPQWRKGFIQWFKAFVSYLKEQGLDYSQWFWYPFDETLSDAFLQQAKLVKQIDPNVRIWTDAATVDPEELEVWLPLIDVWCPEYWLLVRGREGPDNKAYRMLKDAGATIWGYWGGYCTRTIDPTLRYRSCGWLAWKYGLSGVTFYTSIVNRGDRWTDFDSKGGEQATVFASSRGVLNSRRWDGFRDGIEDYQYLQLLRQLAQKATPERREAALALIEESTDTMLADVINALKTDGGIVRRHELMRQYTPAMARAHPDRAERALWTPAVARRTREIRATLAGMIMILTDE